VFYRKGGTVQSKEKIEDRLNAFEHDLLTYKELIIKAVQNGKSIDEYSDYCEYLRTKIHELRWVLLENK